MARPSKPLNKLSNTDREPSPTRRVRPTSKSANNSGGPKRSANRPSTGAAKTKTIVAKVPPINEPIAAIPKAELPRPCFAIW